MTITNRDIKNQDKEIIETFGFLRYSIGARYGYHAVDEHPKDKQNCVSHSHIVATTKYYAYMYRRALLAGAYAIEGKLAEMYAIK